MYVNKDLLAFSMCKLINLTHKQSRRIFCWDNLKSFRDINTSEDELYLLFQQESQIWPKVRKPEYRLSSIMKFCTEHA